MSNAALAFFSGLAGGYMQGKENEDKKARQDKRDAREQEEHDARMAERRVKSDGDKALKVAATPATVVAGANGMTLPESMDNRDVGLPENDAQPNGGLVKGVRVGDQAFADPKAAEAAAAGANTPQAVRGRQVAALQGIDPERALKLEASALTVDNARAEQAKKLKEEGVFDTVQAARRGDAQGVFDSFNKGGAFKLQELPTVTPELREIPGVGKIQTFTYKGTLVGPDGKVVPFQKNSHDLSMEVMPFEKAIDVQQKATKEVREGEKDRSIITENNAKAGYYNAAASAQTAKADATVNAPGKPVKLDEDDKIRITSANTRVRDAEKAVVESMGKLMPGDDPSKSPGVVAAQGMLRAAKLDHLRTNIELGQVPPKAMANQILGVAKSPQEIMKSLTELGSIDGDYSEQVAAVILKTDTWKAMSPGQTAPKTPTGKSISTAPPGSVALQKDGSYAGGGARPAAAAGMPGPAAQPGADPAGQRLDQAREVVRRLQATAPGLAKGRQAIEEHAAAVEAARAELRDAEGAYQRMVEGQARPYLGGGRAAPAAAAGMSAGR